MFNVIISYTTQSPSRVDPLIVSQNHNKIKHVSKHLTNIYYEKFDKL